MREHPEAIANLTERLNALENRVRALENTAQGELAGRIAAPHAAPAAHLLPHEMQQLAKADASGIFPMLGRATLGIAGAYILRAVAEAGYLPAHIIDLLAIAYAFMWLFFAARVKTEAWFAGSSYSCTSGMILAPMLWEMTLRFHSIPPEVAAAVLAAFALAAVVLTWQRNLGAVYWVAMLTAVSASLALMIAAHDLVPFLLALLLMAISSEYAVLCRHTLNARFFVAAAVDFAVWALIYLYSSPATLPADYHAVAAPLLPAIATASFFLYAASILFLNVVRRTTITRFEILQLMTVYLLAAYAWLYLFGHSYVPIGEVCLTCAACLYLLVFLRFEKCPSRRNYRVYAAWSLALTVLGLLLTLTGLPLSIAFGVAALAATVAGLRRDCLTLKYHGMVYLVALAAVSGMFDYIFRALAATLPTALTLPVGVGMVSAVACYFAGWKVAAPSHTSRVPHIVFAVLTVCSAAALLVVALARMAAGFHAVGDYQVAFIRTIVSCALAMALAYSGARLRHRELVWIAYGALVFMAAKLLFEDIRLGHLIIIAVSLILYAAALILIPRLSRPVESGGLHS